MIIIQHYAVVIARGHFYTCVNVSGTVNHGWFVYIHYLREELTGRAMHREVSNGKIGGESDETDRAC